MIASLRGLSECKKGQAEDFESLKRRFERSELQVSVLRSEVATATDFLLEQEAQLSHVKHALSAACKPSTNIATVAAATTE